MLVTTVREAELELENAELRRKVAELTYKISMATLDVDPRNPAPEEMPVVPLNDWKVIQYSAVAEVGIIHQDKYADSLSVIGRYIGGPDNMRFTYMVTEPSLYYSGDRVGLLTELHSRLMVQLADEIRKKRAA
jgi:hypothetical protein